MSDRVVASLLTELDGVEPMRDVVVLKHLRGCTLAQIAGEIGRSVPAVASLMRVAALVATSTTQAWAYRKSPSNTRSSSRFLMLDPSSLLRGSVVT